MNNERILLITSTISPKSGTFLLKVTNANERLEQYRIALVHYIKLLESNIVDKIVYVDNSGHSLKALESLSEAVQFKGKIEFISYTSTVDPNNSRYFLEMNLIDEAMSRSDTLSARNNSFIWKATGRYIVVNAAKIISSKPNNVDLYINLRNYPYKTLDFYFFGFSRKSYNLHIGENLKRYEGLENGEDILRRSLDNGDLSGFEFTPRLRKTPRIKGVRGFDAGKYGGTSDTAKYFVRRLLNTILPSIWL